MMPRFQRPGSAPPLAPPSNAGVPLELPIIMVTARDQSEHVVEAFKLGANDYVTKPIDFPVVLARIATQVSHKRAQVAALRESEERCAAGGAMGTNNGKLCGLGPPVRRSLLLHAAWKTTLLGYEEHEIGRTSPDEWLPRRIHIDDVATCCREQLAAHRRGANAALRERAPRPAQRTRPSVGCSVAGSRSGHSDGRVASLDGGPR